jgi:hypothetical protein
VQEQEQEEQEQEQEEQEQEREQEQEPVTDRIHGAYLMLAAGAALTARTTRQSGSIAGCQITWLSISPG